METPEGQDFDSLEDDLFFQIRWHLLNMRELQRMRVEELGDTVMQDDRYLTDFSLPWRNIPDVDAPKWLIEEWHREREQLKAQATTVSFPGGITVYYDDNMNRVRINSGRGMAEFPRSICAELGRLLISLDSPMPDGAVGSSDVSQRSAPPAHLSAVEKARWQRNQDALDYAVKAERTRQDALIRAQQVEVQQRRNRW